MVSGQLKATQTDIRHHWLRPLLHITKGISTKAYYLVSECVCVEVYMQKTNTKLTLNTGRVKEN